MDEDGKNAAAAADGEECEEPTAEPKPFNKDRLVLYHWTQSFASQKVRVERRGGERREEEKKRVVENGGVFPHVSRHAVLFSFCVFLCKRTKRYKRARRACTAILAHAWHGDVGV